MLPDPLNHLARGGTSEYLNGSGPSEGDLPKSNSLVFEGSLRAKAASGPAITTRPIPWAKIRNEPPHSSRRAAKYISPGQTKRNGVPQERHEELIIERALALIFSEIITLYTRGHAFPFTFHSSV